MSRLRPPTPPLPRPAKLVGIDLLDALLRPAGVFGFSVRPGPVVELAIQPRGVDDDGEPYPVERFALPITDARELGRDLTAVLGELDGEPATDPFSLAHPEAHL